MFVELSRNLGRRKLVVPLSNAAPSPCLPMPSIKLAKIEKDNGKYSD